MKTAHVALSVDLTGEAVNMTEKQVVAMLKRALAIAHEDASATVRDNEGNLTQPRRCLGLRISSGTATFL